MNQPGMSAAEALAVMELPANATWEEVRKEYRVLVKVWHPDRFPGDANFQARATAKIQAINAAYRTLESSFRTDYVQSAPPPLPKTEPTAPATGAAESTGWFASPDELVRVLVGHARYRVFPCRVGKQQSDDSSMVTASQWSWWIGLVMVFFNPILGIFLICFSLVLRILFWLSLLFANPKRRADAFVVTTEGVIILHEVWEVGVVNRRHRVQSPVYLTWAQLPAGPFAWVNNELTILHLDNWAVTVKPAAWFFTGTSRHTGYYTQNVASMDELSAMLNQRAPLMA